MSLAVDAIDLKKTFDGVPVVNGISFQIRPGESIGLFGPAGCGKSTLLKLLYGQLKLTSGELLVLGLNSKNDMSEIKSRIGVMPQGETLDLDFNVIENLLMFASYHGMDSDESRARVDHLMSEMKLSEFRFKNIAQLSMALKKRLVIARSLLNKPQLLILDDPSQDLDIQAQNWLWDYFEKLKHNNITFVIATSNFLEVQKLCQKVILIDHGITLDQGEVNELIKKHIGESVVELSAKDDKNYWINKIIQSNLNFQEFNDVIYIYFKSVAEKENFVSLIKNTNYSIRESNLADVFLKLAGYPIV